jgi:hypothetical protein
MTVDQLARVFSSINLYLYILDLDPSNQYVEDLLSVKVENLLQKLSSAV